MDLSTVIEVEDATWEKVVETGKKPVVVMFFSFTCPYCKAIEPHFRQLAEEYKGSVVFAVLNVETNPWTTERFGVQSTPTFKYFCQGKPVWEQVGMVYPSLIKKMVEALIKNGEECTRNRTPIGQEISGYV